MTQEAAAACTLVNDEGLHARPAVKLTQLARTFAATVEVAASAQGPWVDAKRVVKLMGFRARKGDTMHVRAVGPDAAQAVAQVRALVEAGFDEAARPG